MLPPPTVPQRSTTTGETESTSITPASSTTSSTVSVPIRQRSSFASNDVWSDRAYISSGAFAGKSMRFNLEVAQQPIHGRRKTEKDRRPLAHCPIVRLRLKECKRLANRTVGDNPEWEEEEIDVSTVESSNFICAADLFSPDETPSGSPSDAAPVPRLRATDDPVVDRAMALDERSTPSSSASRTPRASPDRPRRPPPAPLSVYPSRSIDGDITMGRTRSFLKGDAEPGPMPPRGQVFSHSDSSPSVMRTARDAPAHLPEGLGELHETQQTTDNMRSRRFGRNLYGNSHVSGIRVPAPEGGVGLWFLFTDVTVKHEGTYTLRFRCFDITAVPTESAIPSPALVTTHSQSFTVYSPRNFPGIPKPTELAEHFNRLGFKLNTRKNERTAPDPAPASGSSASASSNRRPSPRPIQHEHRQTSSLGRYSTSASGTHLNASSSTEGGGGSSSTGTDTGTLTAPSSTGGSGMLSGGSGGIPASVAVHGSSGLSRVDGVALLNE